MTTSDNQFKTSRYGYMPTHMNPMVTTYQEPIIGTQKLVRKEYKQTTKENH